MLIFVDLRELLCSRATRRRQLWAKALGYNRFVRGENENNEKETMVLDHDRNSSNNVLGIFNAMLCR